MMNNVLSQITQHLNNHPQVSAAWLFGSVAAGNARKDSDIDIAVLFIPGLSKYERFDLRLGLMGELERLSGREADVVDMQSAPLFLQHQIRKTGRLIVEKNKPYRVAFDVHSRQKYFDLAPMLERRSKKIIKKVLGE